MPSILLFLALLSLGCSAGPSVRVDDGLLVQLSHDQMEGVRQARLDRDEANDALAAAVLARQDARDRLDVARKRRDVARSQIKLSALLARIGEERGTATEAAAARQLQAHDKACLERVEQEIELRKLEQVQADRSRGLAQERVKLCSAQVMLEKARALAVLDSAQASRVTVEQADIDVQGHYARVQDLQTRMQAATADVRVATELHAELGRAAEKLRP